MKKISNWSIAGVAAGLLFIIITSIRYFIMYPDMDKALAYVVIGCLIITVSWIYNKLLSMGNDITAIEDYLADKQSGERVTWER